MANADQPDIAIDRELVLRPWQPTDVSVVVDAFSIPDIQHWHFRRVDTETEAAEWIAACAEGWRSETSATWAIVERSEMRIAGRVSVYTELDDGWGEVSYWVLPHARGRGVATRACVAATRWAHALGLNRIQVQCSTQNVGSCRVAIRAGFIEEGVRRGANLHADGWHDMRLYSHLPTDSFEPPLGPPTSMR